MTDEELNPMGLRLESQTEKGTGNTYYELVEADGGRVTCPVRSIRPDIAPNCTTKCAWFFTECNILRRLGLEIAVELKASED